MIISASRRTDIPARYAEWFYNRLRDGYVLGRNPMRFHQVMRISLAPEDVDGIVFWTKNPYPMLSQITSLAPYAYYFQFTLTSYSNDMEPGVPLKSSTIIPTFQRLAELIGPDRVIWRYDPILFSGKYTAEYHKEYFYEIARRLYGYTNKCIISFLDDYRSACARLQACGLTPVDEAVQTQLAGTIASTARSFQMTIETCAEKMDLSTHGIGHAKCIDGSLLDKIRGYSLKALKDKNQRPHCGCDASVDIGSYNTCQNGCLYCYANHAPELIAKAVREHDPFSPLLTGKIGPSDEIKARAKRA